MKHFFCSAIMMMLAVAAGAAPAGEWRDLSGQAGHSAGFVLADGEFPSGANGWKRIDGKAIPGGAQRRGQRQSGALL